MTVVEARAKVIQTGRPWHVGDSRPDHIAYVHADDPSAERSAEANREQYDHPSWVEWRDGIAVTVVNLRPAIARCDAARLAGEA